MAREWGERVSERVSCLLARWAFFSFCSNGAGEDRLAVSNQGGEHKYLLGEICHMLGRGNQCGRKHRSQVMFVHLVDRIV